MRELGELSAPPAWNCALSAGRGEALGPRPLAGASSQPCAYPSSGARERGAPRSSGESAAFPDLKTQTPFSWILWTPAEGNCMTGFGSTWSEDREHELRDQYRGLGLEADQRHFAQSLSIVALPLKQSGSFAFPPFFPFPFPRVASIRLRICHCIK